MIRPRSQQEEGQKYLEHFKGSLDPGHIKVYDMFTKRYGDELGKIFKTLKIQDIQNLKQLSEKNFCRFLFSVYAKRKSEGYILSDAEHGMKRFGHLFIILAGALVLSCIICVLMASFAPSLLLFVVSLAAIYCIVSVLKSFSQKKEAFQESDEEIVDNCINECLSRDLSDSIFDSIINLFPGKSLCAKMPGPVGRFFNNTRDTKHNDEAGFLVDVILENVGVVIVTTVMTQMFATITGFGAVAGTITALSIVFALACAVYKVVHGLFLYDKKQTDKELEELNKKLEKQREGYCKEYGMLLEKLGDKLQRDDKIRKGDIQQPSSGQKDDTKQSPSSKVEGASSLSQVSNTNNQDVTLV